MKLHDLAPAEGAHKERRRLGRGHGSGRGKTAGRGTKGQNARAGKGVKLFFEGGQNPWTMRVPHRRGFSRNRFKVIAQVINLRDLEGGFAPDETVTLEGLQQRGLISDASGRRPVKLLADGQLTKTLVVEVHRASAEARRAVERAGGRLTLLGGPPPGEGETEGEGETAPETGATAGQA
jgi:large subunit ribosomal protein L15